MDTVFFINHIQKQCGVYQFGYHIGTVISKSTNFDIKYLECSSVAELRQHISAHLPKTIIYNFYPSTLGWCVSMPALHPEIRHILIRHEPEPWGLPAGFEEIYPDPTEPEIPGKWKTGRLVKPYDNKYPTPEIPTFGSFGFVFGKSFGWVIQLVEKEYDQAIVNLHIPAAHFGDSDGAGARKAAAEARSYVTKPGIQLNITHDFLSPDDLIEFLAKNSLNIFCYDINWGRGISSTIDYALTARRPIAITDSRQFKHLDGIKNLLCIPTYTTIKAILERGISPLRIYQQAWAPENLLKSYERILRG
jgi:hypothetical protein